MTITPDDRSDLERKLVAECDKVATLLNEVRLAAERLDRLHGVELDRMRAECNQLRGQRDAARESLRSLPLIGKMDARADRDAAIKDAAAARDQLATVTKERDHTRKLFAISEADGRQLDAQLREATAQLANMTKERDHALVTWRDDTRVFEATVKAVTRERDAILGEANARIDRLEAALKEAHAQTRCAATQRDAAIEGQRAERKEDGAKIAALHEALTLTTKERNGAFDHLDIHLDRARYAAARDTITAVRAWLTSRGGASTGDALHAAWVAGEVK